MQIGALVLNEAALDKVPFPELQAHTAVTHNPELPRTPKPKHAPNLSALSVLTVPILRCSHTSEFPRFNVPYISASP